MIEIRLEDVGGTSWWRSLLTSLGNPSGFATMRFVARDLDLDGRQPPVAVGPTFLRPRSLPDDVPPDEAWCPGMDASLATLHEQLAARGWRPDGHGEHPWSERFTRLAVSDS